VRSTSTLCELKDTAVANVPPSLSTPLPIALFCFQNTYEFQAGIAPVSACCVPTAESVSAKRSPLLIESSPASPLMRVNGHPTCQQ
jgi:hypothetical protein